MQIDIPGIGFRDFAPDRVSEEVSAAFQAEIEKLMSLYQEYLENYDSLDDEAAAKLYQELLAARQALTDMADQGVLLGDGSRGVLNESMGESINTLLQLFDLAGITEANAQAPIEEQAASFKFWMSLSGMTLEDAIKAGLSGKSFTATLLEYMRSANDMITNQLGDLEEALGLTDTEIQLLTKLQNIANKVVPRDTVSPEDFDKYTESLNNNEYVEWWKNWGNDTYNQRIGVVPQPSQEDIAFFEEMKGEDGQLYKLVESFLLVADPPFTGGIEAAFNADGTLTEAASYLQGTPAESLYQVYHDMNSSGNVYNWMTDGMGPEGGANTGDFANNLSAAIVSAESMNDQQKQEIQKTMFLFQEFYQSGSGILTILNQIITAMAKAAAG